MLHVTHWFVNSFSTFFFCKLIYDNSRISALVFLQDGGKYGELFGFALHNFGILLIGLYRFRDTSSSSGSPSSKRYVITNPPDDFLLLPTDQVRGQRPKQKNIYFKRCFLESCKNPPNEPQTHAAWIFENFLPGFGFAQFYKGIKWPRTPTQPPYSRPASSNQSFPPHPVQTKLLFSHAQKKWTHFYICPSNKKTPDLHGWNIIKCSAEVHWQPECKINLWDELQEGPSKNENESHERRQKRAKKRSVISP